MLGKMDKFQAVCLMKSTNELAKKNFWMQLDCGDKWQFAQNFYEAPAEQETSCYDDEPYGSRFPAPGSQTWSQPRPPGTI